jgi:hypothetical protein
VGSPDTPYIGAAVADKHLTEYRRSPKVKGRARDAVEKELYWLWRKSKKTARSIRTLSAGGGPGSGKKR